MVEKVSEVSMNVAINGDSPADDNALLNRIEKKKKQEQGGENSLPIAMFPPSSLIRLTTVLAQGGGQQKTEKPAVKAFVPASLDLAADTRQMQKGDALSRQVALAVANQMNTLNTDKKSVNGQKEKVSNVLSSKVVMDAPKSEKQATAPVPVNVATTTLIDAATKLQPSAMAQQPQTAVVVNPLIVNKSAQEADTGHQKNQLRTKEDISEARPLWQGTRQAESIVPKQGETTAQTQNSPATLQQLKTQASSAREVKGASESQPLEVKFQFQRWTGDHSVKISVPTEARREGNVTLLPSDARAADVLQRNMSHLTGLNPDLLRPQQERDEQQQQRRQQQQQDEDQE